MAKSKTKAKLSKSLATNARGSYKEHLKAPFLKAFEKARGIGYIAAEAVGIAPHLVSAWKKADPAFLAEFTKIEINCKGRDNEKLVRACITSAIEGDPEYLIKDGQNVPQRNEDGEPMKDAAGNPIFVTVRRRFDGHLRTFMLERRIPEEFSNRIETKVAQGVIAAICSLFMSAVRRIVPEFCPHCKTHLGLHAEIAKELETQSAKMPVT